MVDALPGTMMVIAKTPEPGRSKTRLCPPLTSAQACDVAWACLHDTLAVVADLPVSRRVLVLDGEPGAWIPAGFDVIRQRGAGLAARLAAAFTDVDDAAVVIAMDTPQVTGELLADALNAVAAGAGVASFGPAGDGGFWLLGLPRGAERARVFEGVPMSVAHTGAAQRARLHHLGYEVRELAVLRDVDTFEDLGAVAHLIPGSMTAHVAALLGEGPTPPTSGSAPSELSGRAGAWLDG